MRKNRKPEAAKARSGSKGPPAETGNRKPPRQGAAAGDLQPKPETGNRKRKWGKMVKNGEKKGKMKKNEENWKK